MGDVCKCEKQTLKNVDRKRSDPKSNKLKEKVIWLLSKCHIYDFLFAASFSLPSVFRKYLSVKLREQ